MFFYLAACFLVLVVPAVPWCYHGATCVDPSQWPDHFPNCADTEHQQSPVNVKKAELHHKESLGKMKFNNYTSSDVTLKLENLGTLAKIKIDGSVSVEGGGLPEHPFHAEKILFHWGSDDSLGSEHAVDTKHFPLEMQIVHYNTKYDSFTDAVNHTDGIAILAFFGETERDGTHHPDNEGFAPLIDALQRVHTKDSHVQLEGVKMSNFMPPKHENFLRYHGSLTIPHCYQSVAWTIFTDHIFLSSAQVEAFRALRTGDETSSHLEDNFRPVKPLHGRHVMSNFELDSSQSHPIAFSIYALFTIALGLKILV